MGLGVNSPVVQALPTPLTSIRLCILVVCPRKPSVLSPLPQQYSSPHIELQYHPDKNLVIYAASNDAFAART